MNFTLPDGTIVDTRTGDVVGQKAPTALPSQQVATFEQKRDVEKPVARTAMDALKQLSWGFNSTLFALPDAAVEKVGRALNIDEKEIPSFVKMFNVGQVAPEGMAERFALSIGKAAGAGMPFTGLLGMVAKGNALRAPLDPNSGVMKRVAKDMLDYVRKDPAGAVKADLAFGGIYGGIEQAVEEFMEPGEGKDIAKSVVPMVGVLAVPAALQFATRLVDLSPTVRLTKAAIGPRQPGDVLTEDLASDPILADMLQSKALKIPGVGWAMGKAQRIFANAAAQRVQDVTKPLTDPTMGTTSEALRVTRELEDFIRTDPTLSKLNLADRWLLDTAQSSLYAPLVAAKNQLSKNLSGEMLKREVLREEDLTKLFGEAFEALAPKAAMPLDDALRVYWADDQAALAKAMQQVKDLTETEALSLSDRFRAIDLNDIGDNLRRSVIAQMDGQFYKLQNQLKSIGVDMPAGARMTPEGMIQDFSTMAGGARRLDPEGVPLPVRSNIDEVYPGIPAADFEDFAKDVVKRFSIPANNRLFGQTGTPLPVQQISSILNRIEKAKERQLPEIVRTIIEERFVAQYPKLANMLDDPLISQRNENITNFIIGKDKNYKNPFESALRSISPSGKLSDSQKTAFYSGVANNFGVKPKDLGSFLEPPEVKSAANILALARSDLDKTDPMRITLPETIDLLGSSLRHKNFAFLQYNKMIENGTPRHIAQQYLDVSNALHRDVEKFAFNSAKFAPDANVRRELENWFDQYRSTFNDGYEKYFPMLISKRKTTGEPYISSEAVVSEALKSGDNIRALNLIMGTDNPIYNKTLTDVMYDQAYRANVLDKDGLLDPKKYNRWLQTKQNIINALPDPVQATLRDEARAADNLMTRLRDMNKRVEDMQDLELDTAIKKSLRPGADVKQLVAQATSDPAVMKQLVDRLGKDPQKLESLRRQVWLSVEKDLFNPNNPTFLKEFLQRNGKSLNMIYDAQHMDNLRKLAEMQHRIFVGDSIVGKTDPFLSADERLKQVLGASISNIESTARAATIRQISPFHAVTSLLARLVSRQQTNVYEAVLYKALTDPRYAHELVNATANAASPQGLKQQASLVSKVGYDLASLIKPAAKVAGIEAVQAVEEGQGREIPVRAPQPISAAPVAPPPATPAPARALTQSAPARTLPQMPAQTAPTDYARFSTLFPQDFLSPLLQQQAVQQMNQQ